ncbi:YggS family pyridoxal phosphate-dependent enzyme [Neptuniibacter sp. 2_MG-2023]|uniref:YggS family pyridoxal phosphate-dependent enzyme n=1 Tax=Neptuniibacter sp. 2_MG-2023 TaxID=3062671 RepID=UPI0026E3CB4F|nr:YggS family pyridoxal phosphate-dependent enzyme [Neptuniibacter sp. 2_MG-2023]MDO6515011.1 YggS family pyridoxal phosphate-dependent enzyme [Neptuniibacter sp. 2_MG-2023]
MSRIAENLIKIHQQLEINAQNAQRTANEITLLAVSKTRPPEDLIEAYQNGQRDFGENYLQESLDKIVELKDLDICWHFIGPIQSNKTKAIAENFTWVHTVERLKIAQRLSAQRPTTLPPLNICLQVNISEEESKSGCLPEELPALAADINGLPNLCLRGLMAIPKATNDINEQKAAFAKMKALQLELQAIYPHLDTLSMGMSGDMDTAIAEGATIVRIGTAIFGQRQKK